MSIYKRPDTPSFIISLSQEQQQKQQQQQQENKQQSVKSQSSALSLENANIEISRLQNEVTMLTSQLKSIQSQIYEQNKGLSSQQICLALQFSQEVDATMYSGIKRRDEDILSQHNIHRMLRRIEAWRAAATTSFPQQQKHFSR